MSVQLNSDQRSATLAFFLDVRVLIFAAAFFLFSLFLFYAQAIHAHGYLGNYSSDMLMHINAAKKYVHGLFELKQDLEPCLHIMIFVLAGLTGLGFNISAAILLAFAKLVYLGFVLYWLKTQAKIKMSVLARKTYWMFKSIVNHIMY